MSGSKIRERDDDRTTPEDCRRIADELRDEGLELLPPRLEEYAEQLEGESDV